MLHPLLYTSPRLSPLRPYSNAVLARLLHPPINYGHPAPRWFVKLPEKSKGDEDPTEKQSTAESEHAGSDPRIVFGETEFKTLRDKYIMPKHVAPLVCALVDDIGGSESLALPPLATVHYWRGIKEALEQTGCERVVITRVPRTASIENRAEILRQEIATKCKPGEVLNLIAHSMPTEFQVKSLTTIATPHRGSTFADYVLSYFISPHPTSPTPAPSPPAFFRFLQSLGIETAAFEELTTRHMEDFNSVTLDDPDVRYYSFGASFTPTWGSVFRTSHGIIEAKEGPNDGLVSVSSAMWGEYKGTIRNVNHLDIINWVNHFCIVRLTGGKTNRIKYWWNGVMYGEKWAEPAFNAIAFYLHVAGNDT